MERITLRITSKLIVVTRLDIHKGLKAGDSIDVEIYEVDAVMGKIFAKPLDE